MSNKRDYEIIWNVTTNSIKLPNISVFNTDVNIFNFKLYVERGTGKHIVRATHDELAKYKIVLKTVKKKTNTYITHDGVLDVTDNFFLFDLPEKFSNAVDSYNCQLFLTDDKNTADITTDDEVVTSNPFTYSIKPSITTDLNGAIESNPDKPILEELIAEVKGLSGLDPDATETLLSPYEKKVNIPRKTLIEDGKIYLAKSDGTKIDSGTTLPLGVKREDLVVVNNAVTMTNSDVQNITISVDTTVTLPSNVINQELHLNVKCNTKDSILTFKNGNETTKLKLAANSYNVFQISANGSDYIIERKSTDYPELTEDEINSGITNEGMDLSNYQTKTDATLTTTSKKIVGAINELDEQFNTIAKKTSVENGKLYLLQEDGTKIDVGTTLPTGSGDTSNLSIRKVNIDEIFTLDAELPKNFTITNNLTNATNNNSATNVTEGNSYTATISPNSNYAITSITVTMGEVDITSSAVNGNNINITSVTGNIIITVITTSTLIPCTKITLNNNNLSFTTKETQTLIATVEPLDTDDTVTWKSSNDSIATVVGGIVTPIRTGSCAITATCGSKSATCNVTITLPLQSFTITNNLTNCTSNNSNTSIQEGSSYNATITATSDYSISNTSITMGGVNITSTAYSNGVITISQVTGNIVITITAIKVVNVVTDGLVKSLYDVTSSTTIDNANSTYFNINNEEFTVFAKCTITADTTNYATTLGGSAHPLTMQIAWNGEVAMILQVSDGTSNTYPALNPTFAIDTTSYDQTGESVFLAFVGNKSNIRAYMNNVLKSGTLSFSDKTYTPPTSIKVGGTNKKVTWLYYNRVLTAEELTQNYTALGGVV